MKKISKHSMRNMVTLFASIILALILSECLLRVFGRNPWSYKSSDSNEPTIHAPDLVLGFRASFGAKVFYLSFLFAGIGVIIFLPYFTQSSDGFSFDTDTIMPLLIAFAFLIAGGCLFYFGITPIVFDKQIGFFWKGRKAPEGVFDEKVQRQSTKLKNIYALQLISEYVRSDKKSYYSYELNIVLKNNRRINIVDHGKKDRLREDAETLSAFLGKPVWMGYD